MAEPKELGDWGEAYAAQILEGKGYQCLAKKWRCQAGEIDLIMQDGPSLVFVEVKTRRGRQVGTPEAAMTPQKMARLFEVAASYLYEHDLDEESDWRVDMVAVELTATGKLIRCQHWQAIGLDW